MAKIPKHRAFTTLQKSHLLILSSGSTGESSSAWLDCQLKNVGSHLLKWQLTIKISSSIALESRRECFLTKLIENHFKNSVITMNVECFDIYGGKIFNPKFAVAWRVETIHTSTLTLNVMLNQITTANRFVIYITDSHALF